MKYLLFFLLLTSISGFAQKSENKPPVVQIPNMVNSANGEQIYPDILIDGVLVGRSKFDAFDIPPKYIRKLKINVKDTIIVLNTKLPYEVGGRFIAVKERGQLKGIASHMIESVKYIPADTANTAGLIRIKIVPSESRLH